jgi:DNA-binding beta-propeller fold protein YncE
MIHRWPPCFARVVVVAGGAVVVVGVVVGGGGACTIDPQRLNGVAFDVSAGDTWIDGAPRAQPAAPGEARLIVTNNLDDTVSVVSLERLLQGRADAELSRFVVGQVPLEREGPHHVAVDKTGRVAFVGISNYVPGSGSGPHGVHGNGTAQGRALRIDLDTLTTTTTTRVDRNPGDIRLTPGDGHVLLTHFDLVPVNDAAALGIFEGPTLDARLAVLDPATLRRRALVPLCPAAHGMAVTTDARTVVSSCLSDEIAIVDLDAALAGDLAAVTRVTLLDQPGIAANPVCGPYAVTIGPLDQTAWVSCYRSGELVGVDVATRTRTGEVVVLPGLAVFGDFADHPVVGGALLALAVQDTDGVAFVIDDGQGRARLDRFVPLSRDVCPLPHTTHFVDDDRALLVVCEGNKRDAGSVIALDVESGAVLGRVEVGIFPDDLAIALPPPPEAR